MVVLALYWVLSGVIERLGCGMGGYGGICYAMVIYMVALYIDAPNHLLLLLLLSASVNMFA